MILIIVGQFIVNIHRGWYGIRKCKLNFASSLISAFIIISESDLSNIIGINKKNSSNYNKENGESYKEQNS